MANNITINAALAFASAGITWPTTQGGTPGAIGPTFTNFVFTSVSGLFIAASPSISTSGQALDLGPVTSPHWSVFYNQDPTNYVTLYNGSGGAVFARLMPGEFALVPLDTSCVPYAKANTANTSALTYLIIDS